LNDQLGPSRSITLEISPDRLQHDLEHFRQKSVELGAAMAQVIPADWVQIDERVRLKRSVERHAAADWTRKSFEIVGTLETLAFGSGYYLAMGFGQGSCRKALCGQNRCLILEGGNCPYFLKARPSMEAVGIDVYGLVTRVGWEIYPIYRSVDPAQVPRALSVGIVFVH
jgi:predicted metal-binding protein